MMMMMKRIVPAASPLLVGALRSFLQLIQLLLRPLSNSRSLSHQPMFFAIAPDMLPHEISILHSRCIQMLLQSSSRFRSSDAFADVQMDLGPDASQLLISNYLARHSKETLELSPTHSSRTSPWVSRGATISLSGPHSLTEQYTRQSLEPRQSRFHGPSSYSDCLIVCWPGSVLVHHSFSESQLPRVSLSRNTQKCGSPVVLHLKLRQAPRSVTNRPGQRNALI